jgi:hypothetical protein
MSQKTVLLRFFGKNFQTFFFKNRMKIPLIGDFGKKILKIFHQKTQKYGFFGSPCKHNKQRCAHRAAVSNLGKGG